MNARRDKLLAQKSKLSSAVLFTQLKWLSSLCEPDNRAGGGEYSVQQGFGWTNGVTSRFYRLVFLAGS
ncbi:hypothetical protein HH219_21435 [Pseudoalteromonas sp. NEC-BIFX-2020_015]|nr:hypothetical protein [Pseudoalteromonas sp. NEC-BIFX-2020_015]